MIIKDRNWNVIVQAYKLVNVLLMAIAVITESISISDIEQ
jgi:hypothetical protein